ncbi:bifunctional UDP-N-acetylglucosamine diphosphorylase/glucosamine-1-phosphate N-acetyltransferase GlmU [Rhodopila sp.]|uniref:bifunctional UDP-N-acetylglucosamine diphosphorylase/glucosamine-1-phosphate N-acetyltransferase GlmU n=1 Tax=Rhodopila sp. TaxID=2480087 RepID=UPI002BD896CC|nr:bifunctional UDP-N-acetylglucosamine diphosphorylase/glucosamine-1-phosphate N-acetyltransferase GlmU [Rhodopila sp.]HVZ07664.1 bifunctional UDP-N-acetylglucosamine diphosphorylase/glucosamine-1-phosphate N-acetyltransferase GlmU [Rhodopila sp.]
MHATAIILAAGLGTRMKSALPKTLHRLAGQTMLRHLLASCEQVFDRIVVVLGPDMDAVRREAAPHVCVVQQERLGTAHAALQAVEAFGTGQVAVLYADNPLIRPRTLQRLLDAASGAGLALLAFRPADPARYGRVLTGGDGLVERVVEYADATPAQRAITLCNAGVLCATADRMRRWLQAVRNDNAKGEYYLTDAVELARADGQAVVAVEASPDELAGINSRAELAQAEAVVQGWLRQAAMDSGVTMIDPASVFLCADTEFAPDVTIEPNVVFGPGVRVASGALIRAFSHIEGASIGPGAIVGPFARLRPGSVLEQDVHVGNFVEVKASTLAAGVKANHLSYIGDASVGARTNVGAGTITCNYDGVNKHRTTIGADVFVGSDVALVAPVTVGDGAILAAGSVITDPVAPDALALARGRQVQKPDRARAMRAAAKKEKL